MLRLGWRSTAAVTGIAAGKLVEAYQYLPAVNLRCVQPNSNLLEYFEAIAHIHFAYPNNVFSTSS